MWFSTSCKVLGTAGQSGSRGLTLSLVCQGGGEYPALAVPSTFWVILAVFGAVPSELWKEMWGRCCPHVCCHSKELSRGCRDLPDLWKRQNSETNSHVVDLISCQGSSDICTGSQFDQSGASCASPPWERDQITQA